MNLNLIDFLKKVPLDDEGNDAAGDPLEQLSQPSNKRAGTFRRSSSLTDLDLIDCPEPVEELKKSQSAISTRTVRRRNVASLTDSPGSQSTMSTLHADSHEFVPGGSLSNESTTDDSSHGTIFILKKDCSETMLKIIINLINF